MRNKFLGYFLVFVGGLFVLFFITGFFFNDSSNKYQNINPQTVMKTSPLTSKGPVVILNLEYTKKNKSLIIADNTLASGYATFSSTYANDKKYDYKIVLNDLNGKVLWESYFFYPIISSLQPIDDGKNN